MAPPLPPRRTPRPLRNLAGLETRRHRHAVSPRPGRAIRHLASPAPLARLESNPAKEPQGPRSAKQEITETIKFLTWLNDTHHRTAATCNQQKDVNEYLASGPTTRHLRSAPSSSGPRRARSTKACRFTPAPTAKPKPPGRSPKTSGWHGFESSLKATPNHCLTVSRESFCFCSLSLLPKLRLSGHRQSRSQKTTRASRWGKSRSPYRHHSQTSSLATWTAAPTS